MAAKSKILNRVQAAYVVRDTPASGGSTTLAAAAAKGASSLSCTASTNFANGDIIRVGAGDEMELCKINGTITGAGPYSFPLDKPLSFAHVSGDVVVEQTVYDLGDVDEGGVSLEFAGEIADLPSAMRRLVFQSLTGYVGVSGSLQLPTLSLHNLAVALGIPFASVTGAGTAADYYQLATDGNDFDSEQNMSLIVVGVLMDGTVARAELWGCDMDYSSLAFTLARGQATPVACRFVASSGGVLDQNANPYVPATTFKAGKGKVFDAISEVGIFVDTGTTTTVASGGAAGSNTVTVASGAGFAADDWVRFGTGETAEYHKIHSTGGGTSWTMKSRFLRAQAASTAVVKVTVTPIAGLDEAGAQININGSVEVLRIATKRMQVGVRPGSALVGFTFPIVDLSLANWAYALGIPQADISAARVALTNMATASDVVGVYAKGTMKDGTTLWMNGWGCAQILEQVAVALAGTGKPVLNLSVRPTSAVQFLNHV